MTDWMQRYNSVAEDLNKALIDVQVLKKNLKEAKTAIQFEKDVNSVTNENRKTERKEHEERIACLKNLITDTDNKHKEKEEALQDYIEQLEKQVDGLKNELTRTTGKIPSRDEVIVKQEWRIAELEEACDKLIDENNEYSSENEKMRIQITAQKQLLVELQIELDALRKRDRHKKNLANARKSK